MGQYAQMTAVRAVIFDFNGTISDDEPLLDRLFRDVFADVGIAMTSEEYFRELAGLSDPDIVARALELSGLEASAERREQLLRAKIDRYKATVSARPAIAAGVAEFVRATAARVPVAIASGAFREEVEHGLALAGLDGIFAAVVCIDDVQRGKPDPEGYETALAALNRAAAPRPPVAPGQALVFEDADAGVWAAKAAGMRSAALLTPAYTGVPVAADLTVERLEPGLIDALL